MKGKGAKSLTIRGPEGSVIGILEHFTSNEACFCNIFKWSFIHRTWL